MPLCNHLCMYVSLFYIWDCAWYIHLYSWLLHTWYINLFFGFFGRSVLVFKTLYRLCGKTVCEEKKGTPKKIITILKHSTNVSELLLIYFFLYLFFTFTRYVLLNILKQNTTNLNCIYVRCYAFYLRLFFFPYFTYDTSCILIIPLVTKIIENNFKPLGANLQ